MGDSEAAAPAALPARTEGGAEAAPAAPRSPPRRRLTGPGPPAAKSSSTASGGSAQADTAAASALPPPALLQQTKSADYAAPSGIFTGAGSQFGRSTRSEEVQAGALARALLAAHQIGAADEGSAAGPPDDVGEPRRARRLTGGRRQLPPRSASVEGELPVIAAADGTRGGGAASNSPTRRQGSLQPSMNGHLSLDEVRRTNIAKYGLNLCIILWLSSCTSRI